MRHACKQAKRSTEILFKSTFRAITAFANEDLSNQGTNFRHIDHDAVLKSSKSLWISHVERAKMFPVKPFPI